MPTSVGGNPQGLARAERKLGLISQSIVLKQNSFNFEVDRVLSGEKSSPIKIEFGRWIMFFNGLVSDVIHYNFGQTIMPSSLSIHRINKKYPLLVRVLYSLYTKCLDFFDVRVFYLLNKVIVVTYQGSDARQDDYCLQHYRYWPKLNFDNIESQISDEQKRKNICKFSKYADCIYALNPDLLHVLPPSAMFMPYAHLDFNDNLTKIKKPINCKKLKIAHAPTNRELKGTKYLLDAVDRLRLEGLEFELDIVEGISNESAKQRYKNADLFVDQLLIGWYGGVAVEVMALGIPVICYVRDEDLHLLPKEMGQDLPIITAKPDTIYSVLKYYLTDGCETLDEIGKKSRLYVEKWHNPEIIATNLQQKYELIFKSKHKTRLDL